MTGLVILALVIALIGLLAACFGADSRDGQDWRRGGWRPPHHPPRPAGADPVAVLRRSWAAVVRGWRTQAGMWERHLGSVQPWMHDRLRWRDDHDGPRLQGRILPSWPVDDADTPSRRGTDDGVWRRPDPCEPPTGERRGLGLDLPGDSR